MALDGRPLESRLFNSPGYFLRSCAPSVDLQLSPLHREVQDEPEVEEQVDQNVRQGEEEVDRVEASVQLEDGPKKNFVEDVFPTFLQGPWTGLLPVGGPGDLLHRPVSGPTGPRPLTPCGAGTGRITGRGAGAIRRDTARVEVRFPRFSDQSVSEIFP